MEVWKVDNAYSKTAKLRLGKFTGTLLLDQTAFSEEFLQRVRRRCEGLFARYRIPISQRDDLFQDAMLALCVRQQDVAEPDRWVFVTVRNRCVDFHRRRLRHFHVAFDETIEATLKDPTQPASERFLLHRDLKTALARVPERCREILALRYHHDLSPDETADRLGYRPNSMKKTTTRCLQAMHKALLDLWAANNAPACPATREGRPAIEAAPSAHPEPKPL